MRLFRVIGKSFKDAFKSIFRNFSLSMASISCTAITLVLVSIALLFTYNVNYVTKSIEDVLNIVVFVDNKTTDEQLDKIKYEIFSDSNVDEANSTYSSKDEIKEQLSEDEGLKSVLDSLDENPLQSTFVIRVRDVKKISETAEKIETMENITSVKYGETVVNKLLSMFDVVRNSCVVAVIALIVVTAFLISNTIKITIFSRKQEIDIMRLVGTSNTVIKMPFLIEGFVLGLIGAILPVVLTIYGYQFVYDFVGGKLITEMIVLIKPAQVIYAISAVLLIVGGIVGMFGSVRAVKRYLKI